MDFYKEWLGIPEGQRPPDHYELLRIKRFEDDLDKIRAHYKKLNTHVRKYATGQYSMQSQDMLNEMAKAMLCLTDIERKRDYDEGMGREFPPERDEFGRQPLLDVLIRQGNIERSQKSEIEEFADRRGLSHRDAVVQMKLVDAEMAAKALAQQLGYSYIDLEDVLPEDSALDLVPRSLVKQYSFIPLFVDDDRLMIATIDEIEHELEEELRLRYGVPVRPVIAVPRAINQGIAKYYAPGMRDEVEAPAPQPKAKSGKKAEKGDTKARDGKKPDKSAAKKGGKPAELSDEEKQSRKQMGILMMCVSIMIPCFTHVLLNSMGTLRVTQPWVTKFWLVTLLTAPPTIGYVLLSYWKPLKNK
ncbi:bacteriophage N4 adsorption protein B [Caulifigura coniformis]|uniref:Bacteriophage N4 adsorption protein B n=1 Tax=Caulifigura coniformis TaxID=2527983 RepID=A0A517SF49_9PLAN|nr:general secretion pathway protein GspE [Caulifigura coniformis]QDT54710.1 bacteriophage N4 adsorption protein B [Caulifigura coniformis]